MSAGRLTITEMRDRPPGQLPCGGYGLPPHHFGVLVNPTPKVFNAWWRADAAFSKVLVGQTYATVTMDLLRAGDMPEESRPTAALVVEAAAARYVAVAARPSTWLSMNPGYWGSRCLRGDALPYGLVLVELWWGNRCGAGQLLPRWINEFGALSAGAGPRRQASAEAYRARLADAWAAVAA